MRKIQIAIITPLLNEENNIIPFYNTLRLATQKLSQYTINTYFIDDGSIDSSWIKIKSLAKNTSHVNGIKLSRNFGSHSAWLAGIEAALKKDVSAFVLTTIDMQNPPQLIPELVYRLKNGTRIVWGVRESRDESGIQMFFVRIYYALVRSLALHNMPIGGTDYCIFDRKVAQDIVNLKEKNTSLMGLLLWLGYPQVFVPFVRNKRMRGKSGWSTGKKIKLFIDTFIAFSYTPIWIVSYLGFSVSFIGFLYAILIFIRRIFYGAPIEGWSSLMLIVLLLSGIQLIMLGIVAQYIWRTLDSSRNRPIFIVDEIV